MPVPASSPMPVRHVLIADDHEVFGRLLEIALRDLPQVESISVARSAAEALDRAGTGPVDVAVVDVHLGDDNGLALIGPLLQMAPLCRVVVLTGFPSESLAARAMALGASAFVSKDGPLEDLLNAITSATRQHPMTMEPPAPPESLALLSPREQVVLRRLVDGMDPTLIAVDLDLSLFTIRDHIKSIRSKLGARSQIEAVAIASRAGWRPSPEVENLLPGRVP